MAIVQQTENLIRNPRNAKAALGWILIAFWNVDIVFANFCDFTVDQQVGYAFLQSQFMTFSLNSFTVAFQQC